MQRVHPYVHSQSITEIKSIVSSELAWIFTKKKNSDKGVFQ